MLNHDKDGSIIIRNQEDFKEWLSTRKNKALYKKNKKGDLVVDHVATANVLCKFIELCPMDHWAKRVMLMRVGYPLFHLKPMSHMQIAIQIGATEDEVRYLEKEGKIQIGRFLQKCSPEEAIGKFNEDSKRKSDINNVKNILLNPGDPAGEKGD